MANHKYTYFVVFVACLWPQLRGCLGACKVGDIAVQDDFDAFKYQRKWYEVSWIPHMSNPDEIMDNYVYDYVLQDDGTLRYNSWGRYITAERRCGNYEGQLVPTDIPGKFTQPPKNRPVWIMETDYVSYTVVYGCNKVNETNDRCMKPKFSVQTRTGSLTPQQQLKVDLILERVCLNKEQLMETKQDNPCPPPALGAAPALKPMTNVIRYLVVGIILLLFLLSDNV